MSVAPPEWQPADPAAWEAARAALPPEPSPPWPGVTEYLADVALRVQRWLLAWIEGAVPAWLASETLWLALVYGIAGLALVGLLVFVARRWLEKPRRSEESPEHPVAPVEGPAELPGPDAWHDRFRAAFEGERWMTALEALWWWTATTLAPPGLSPAWTTDELLRGAARKGVGRPLRDLERLRYGGGSPDRVAVREIEGRLREALA